MLKKLVFTTFITLFSLIAFSQTTLTVAENFHVKTIYGEPIWLFPLLDEENQIVVIDFFSTSCGPCQDYAADFQACYENFGFNESNTYFMGINWGSDNQEVYLFDSIFGLTYPSVSGSQGGGNIVFQDYSILSYPTVIIITPDHNIVEQYVWPPSEDTITAAVIAAGGILVGVDENDANNNDLVVYPNPVSGKGKVQFHMPNSGKLRIRLFNMFGNEIFNRNMGFFDKGIATVDIPTYSIPNGYYLLKVETGNGIVATTRISVLN